MTHKERNESIKKHFDEIMNICSSKGVEYSNSDDANMNFKALGEELGLDPLKVLWVYKQKHNRAIAQFIRSGSVKSNESIQSRIHDEILYDFILLTLLEETITHKTV